MVVPKENRIEIEVVIKDAISKEFERVTKKLDKKAKKTKKSLEKIGKGADKARKSIFKLQKPTLILSTRFGSLRLAALSATGALIGVGAIAFQRTIVASIKRLEGFERQMNVVAAITRSTGAEFKSLENLALKLGGTTIFTASQASEAMTDLARSGKDAADIFEILPKILDVAAAGQLSLANASRIVQNVLAVSNLEAEKAGKVTDILAATSSRSRTTIEGLGKSFQLLAGTQRDVGLTLEETSALLAIIGERGIIGSRAGTSLASAFSSLVKPTVRAQKVLDELGVSILDGSGNIRNFIDFMGDLEKAEISVTQKAILFEKRGLRAVNAILTEGVGSLRKFEKGLGRVGGEAARLAREFNIGLPGAVKKTESAFDKFLITFGKVFEPAVIAGLDSITIALVDITDALEPIVPSALSVAETINFLTETFIRFKTVLDAVVLGFRLLAVSSLAEAKDAIKIFADNAAEAAAKIAVMDEKLENLRFNLQRTKDFESFEIKAKISVDESDLAKDLKAIVNRTVNTFDFFAKDKIQIKPVPSKTLRSDVKIIADLTISQLDELFKDKFEIKFLKPPKENLKKIAEDSIKEFSIQLKNVKKVSFPDLVFIPSIPELQNTFVPLEDSATIAIAAIGILEGSIIGIKDAAIAFRGLRENVRAFIFDDKDIDINIKLITPSGPEVEKVTQDIRSLLTPFEFEIKFGPGVEKTVSLFDRFVDLSNKLKDGTFKLAGALDDLSPSKIPAIAEQLKTLTNFQDRIITLKEKLEKLNIKAALEQFGDEETLTAIMNTSTRLTSLTTGIELLKKALTGLGFGALVGAITTPDMDDPIQRRISKIKELQALIAMPQAIPAAQTDIFGAMPLAFVAEEDPVIARLEATILAIGRLKEAQLSLQDVSTFTAEGMAEVFSVASDTIIGGFIDQAISGDF
ncbi:MAG: phage tail tape measure protein [Thaumarchaeota archaeon]|nr:phage tail tape measure protein [Nitrososphaerota archaeon]